MVIITCLETPKNMFVGVGMYLKEEGEEQSKQNEINMRVCGEESD